VVKARHRLDGVVYAVKITKKKAKRNSRDEKVALNEVFVLAAMTSTCSEIFQRMGRKWPFTYSNRVLRGRQS